MQAKPSQAPRNTLIAATLLWTSVVALASVTGRLQSAGRLVAPTVAAVAMLAIVSTYFAWPAFRAWIGGLGLARLTAVHVLRVAAVPIFLLYGNRGRLPAVFVARAAWGDLAAGLIALAVLLFWRRPAGFWMAHLAGMTDFFVVFATAIPFARQGTAMEAITTLPIVLIPFVGVPLLAATHVMAYDLLLRRGAVILAKAPRELNEAM